MFLPAFQRTQSVNKSSVSQSVSLYDMIHKVFPSFLLSRIVLGSLIMSDVDFELELLSIRLL